MAVFILTYSPQQDYNLKKDQQSLVSRISQINDYITDTESNYLKVAMEINAYKALMALALYVNSTGVYISNFDNTTFIVMLNGTINNVPIDVALNKKIMENYTMENLTKKMAITAQDTLNVNTSITIGNITLSQSSPWYVDISMGINYTVVSEVAKWKRNSVITSKIPIEGLYDPYYLKNTIGPNSYGRKIIISNVKYNEWNITRVKEQILNQTYIHRTDSRAPSFLMRFNHSITNSSCCGIESFVDPNKVIPQDQYESYIDYQFWEHSYSDCTLLYNITGVWGASAFNYFKLYFEDKILYNVTSGGSVISC